MLDHSHLLSSKFTVATFAAGFDVAPLITRALTYYPDISVKVWPTPVVWTSRVSRTAGRARGTKDGGFIYLHIGLLSEGREAIKATFLHELAHIMQWYAHQEINHGESWWKMMHILDQRPARLHAYKSAAFAPIPRGGREELSLDDLE